MSWVREFSFDRERIAWWLVAVVLLAALGYVVSAFLGTFLLGLFVYYATRPMYRRLLGRLHQRTLTAATALLGLALPGLVVLGYTVVVSVSELSSLAGVGVEELEGVLGPGVDLSQLFDPQQLLALLQTTPQQLQADLQQFAAQRGAETARDILSSLVTVLGIAASAALGIVITLVVAFYLLRDDHRLASWFRTEVVDEDSPTLAFAQAVDDDLETVYFGNILTAFVIGILAAISYNLLDIVAPAAVSVPSPTLLGLLTGLASLIPVVGMKLVYVPLGLVLAVVAGVTNPALLWFPVVFLLVAFVVVDTIPELVLRPYVSGRDLHTGLVMLAYVLGPVLFGWYGLFLGPLLLVLVVHFVRVIVPELVERGEFDTEPDTPVSGVFGESASRGHDADSRTRDSQARDAWTAHRRLRDRVRAPVSGLPRRERSTDGGAERPDDER
ncbi:AI-2E family transporter [Halorussus gelatinilyticus]|uniref:AI-2E family transporter n=1 Tax=Halorussus gelatinilyticus TaxID=2937524 RepID=A0A8U0III1_9EURY|nr:AI-2E family transporter [Halorussus gelatinilyticus]UPW00907.1 AI-2E family transporter [Halorussus gelatinilyticus]